MCFVSAMITYSFDIIDLLFISFIVSCREHVSMYVPKEQVMEKYVMHPKRDLFLVTILPARIFALRRCDPKNQQSERLLISSQDYGYT